MKIAVVLQILGALLLSIAGALLHLVVGLSSAGVMALAFGIALERQALATDVLAPAAANDGEG